MLSLQLTGIREMETIEVPEPRIENENDVLLRLGVVGVCGSDVHYYETGRIGEQVVQYPFRVGHECSAVVEAVGPGVRRVQPGDRVAVDPAMHCGVCDQCLAGRAHTCRNLKFLGCPGQSEGCLAERIVMPEASCFPVSDATTMDEAALSEPLSIGLYAVRQAALGPDARIGILGSGPIGLSVLTAARAAGLARAYVTDKIDARLRIAAGQGADWTGNPSTEDVAAAVAEREPLLLDAVFECAGQQETVDQAMRMLKPGGKLMIIGIPREPRLSFEVDYGRRKEITIVNVRRQNGCVQPTLDMIASRNADVSFMATHRFPFERAQEAFDLVAEYRDGVVKAMIDFD